MKTAIALVLLLAAGSRAMAGDDGCADKVAWNVGNREGFWGHLLPAEAYVCVDKNGGLPGVSYRRGDPGNGFTDWMYFSAEELSRLGFVLERTGLRPRDPSRKDYFFEKMIGADLLRRLAEVRPLRGAECADSVLWWRDKKADDLQTPFIPQPLAYVCVRKDGTFGGVSYDDNDNPPAASGYAGGFRYLSAADLANEGYVLKADGVRSRYSPDDHILFHGFTSTDLLSNVNAMRQARPVSCVQSFPWGLSTFGGGEAKTPDAYLCAGDHDRPLGVTYRQSSQPNRWVYLSSGEISAKGWALGMDGFTAFGGSCEGRYSDEAYERLIGRRSSCRTSSPKNVQDDLAETRRWLEKQ
ncbi:MAG: hypothetical protein ACHQ2Z_05560 [Elusimicrobiota bacterium]